jgi:hypothetical protein
MLNKLSLCLRQWALSKIIAVLQINSLNRNGEALRSIEILLGLVIRNTGVVCINYHFKSCDN